MSTVLIVGAGPAGIRAAATLAAAGLVPVVVDEADRAGGQIYRRPPEGFKRSPETLYGSEAHKARALHALFDDLVATRRVVYKPKTSVVSLYEQKAGLAGPDGYETLPYDRLILATGAMDRLVPVKGWQSAGVYSLGATQIALKAQGVALGKKLVLAGSGPLLTLVASQLLKAGAQVEAVLDTAPLSAQVRGGVSMFLARPRVTLRGLMMRLRLGRLYHAGVHLEDIVTDDSGPVAVLWRDARGREQRTECDTVSLGWHLRAETALTDLAAVPLEYSTVWAQWLPRSDEEGRAGNGIYLAGDGLRILGADGAEIAGRLAARSCLSDMGVEIRVAEQARDLRRLSRMRRFAEGVAKAFPWPSAELHALSDETILCRCEGITVGQLRETIGFSGAEANRVKSLSRVGMGRCQGRYCQLAGAELIAAQAKISHEKAGRLRAQSPVRPVTISRLSTTDTDRVSE